MMEGPVRAEPPKVQFWRYSVPNENFEGWAILFVDSVGCFTAVSDWGDVSYRWNIAGLPEGKGMRQFLLGMEDSYLEAKLGGQRKVYDAERTLQSVKEELAEWPEEKRLEEEELLEENENLDTTEHFAVWYRYTSIRDAHEHYQQKIESDVVNFVKRAWPRLKAVIAAELEREKPEAA